MKKRSKADPDLYEVLGVPRMATAEQVKTAYRAAARKYHPDRFGGKPEAERKAAEQTMRMVNAAYEILGNAELRKKYDSKGLDGVPQGDKIRRIFDGGERFMDRTIKAGQSLIELGKAGKQVISALRGFWE